MKKLTITNDDNTRMAVDLIRYFKFNNDCFLIFNKGEIDEKGYHKLYLVRIMEELGQPVVQRIGNEADWAGMQNIVKKVIKDLKRGKIENFEDLDYKAIEGIKVENPRFFKLDQKLTDILSSNYFENESNGLESIDTTIMNEGQFNPAGINIPIINNMTETSEQSETVPSVEEVQPIEPISNEIPVYENVEPINPVVPEVQEVTPEMTVPSVEEVQPMEPISNEIPVYENVEPINPVVPEVQEVTPEMTVPTVEEVQPIEPNTQNIDYETLYKTLKEEHDATNIAMEEILNKLLKYQEKYGEIE